MRRDMFVQATSRLRSLNVAVIDTGSARQCGGWRTAMPVVIQPVCISGNEISSVESIDVCENCVGYDLLARQMLVVI